jgi:TP901-1 family phage major tail protein
MPAQQGRALLLRVETAPDIFTAIAGLRARSLQLSAEGADATDSESPGAWRQLLAGAGLKTAAVTGSGVFKDEASDAALRSAFFAGEIRRYQIVIPDFGTITGPFHIAALEYAGEHDGAASFSITLASAGQLVFAS